MSKTNNSEATVLPSIATMTLFALITETKYGLTFQKKHP